MMLPLAGPVTSRSLRTKQMSVLPLGIHTCALIKGSTDVTNRLPMRDMTLRLLSLLVDSIYNLHYWNPSRDIANC